MPFCDIKRNDNCLMCELGSVLVADLARLWRCVNGYRLMGLRPDLYALTTQHLHDVRTDVRRVFTRPRETEVPSMTSVYNDDPDLLAHDAGYINEHGERVEEAEDFYLAEDDAYLTDEDDAYRHGEAE